MAPFLLFSVMGCRTEASLSGGNNGLDTALLQKIAEPICVIGLVAEESVEGEALDQFRDTGCFPTLARHQLEAHEITQRIGQSQDFGGQPALGLTDRLIFGPPFAPCPWRWTRTMVPSTMAYSKSESAD